MMTMIVIVIIGKLLHPHNGRKATASKLDVRKACRAWQGQSGDHGNVPAVKVRSVSLGTLEKLPSRAQRAKEGGRT